MDLSMVAGSPLTAYENDTSQHVAVIDTTTATTLGISPARLASHPAVFVDGIAYTVVGVYSSAQRVVSDESAMLSPENTALADFGNPEPGIGNQHEAQMVIATRIGAAQEVARQIAAAELPGDPGRLVVTSPPNPQNPQSEVSGDLAGLFLILALISLLGFRAPAGSALSALGIDAPTPGTNPASLPQAEQNAMGKCATIEQNFTNAAQNGPLAGIDTLSTDLYDDVAKDGAVSSAMQAWKACMAKNGYSFTQPGNVFFQELQSMFGGKRTITPGKRSAPPPTRRRSRRPSPTPTAPTPRTWPGSISPSRPATSSRSSTPTSRPSPPRSSSTAPPTPRS